MRLLPVLGFVAVAALTAAAVAFGFGKARASHGPTAEQRARATAVEFFRAVNDGRFAHVCGLLSERYYARNKVTDRRQCLAGLRANRQYTSTQFRITGVNASSERATVTAVANGAPGRIELVRERGRFRVLSVRAS